MFLTCLLSFPVCPQTDTAQLYNTQSDLCMRTPHMDRIGLFCLQSCFQKKTGVVMTSYMVADTSLEHLHGCGAQLVEAAGSSKPQIHKRSCARESAKVSDENYGECVVAIHVPPINGTAQVKINVLDGTEPTLSMTVLEANCNKLVFRGEKR